MIYNGGIKNGYQEYNINGSSDQAAETTIAAETDAFAGAEYGNASDIYSWG